MGETGTMTNADENFVILLAEDDPNDVLLIKRALRKSYVNNPLQVVSDGQEAIDYLCGNPPFDNRTTHPFPSLVITDLKMPRCTGLEFLAWTSKNPAYRVIPTIVLSSSNQEQDVMRAYELGANTYMVKPNDFDGLSNLVSAIRAYWRCSIKPLPKGVRP